MTPEQQFWSWFKANAQALANVEDVAGGGLPGELASRLHSVDPGLAFELGGRPGEEREFVISADGIAEVFPSVRRLANAAPSLPGWKVTAFRPRIGAKYTIHFDGHELNPEDVWFESFPDGSKLGLRLYVRGYTGADGDPLAGASYIMLDAALGEHDVVTHIGWIERRPLPPDPKSAGLRPLGELAPAVDRLKAEKGRAI